MSCWKITTTHVKGKLPKEKASPCCQRWAEANKNFHRVNTVSHHFAKTSISLANLSTSDNIQFSYLFLKCSVSHFKVNFFFLQTFCCSKNKKVNKIWCTHIVPPRWQNACQNSILASTAVSSFCPNPITHVVKGHVTLICNFLTSSVTYGGIWSNHLHFCRWVPLLWFVSAMSTLRKNDEPVRNMSCDNPPGFFFPTLSVTMTLTLTNWSHLQWEN